MSASTRRVRIASAVTGAVSALALAVTGATPAQASPSASAPPRHCLVEYTIADARGGVTAVSSTGDDVTTYRYRGAKVAPGARFVEPVVMILGAAPVMTTLVVTEDGLLQSVTHTARSNEEDPVWSSSAPARLGHGWGAVRDIAVPGFDGAPYMFALLGGRLNRYTVSTRPDRPVSVHNGPTAATSGFGTVRSITWVRETPVRTGAADVLLGLDGARLVEYTVPRVAKPRVTKRVLATRGWGRVSQVHAGACFTSDRDTARLTPATPFLGIVGTQIRYYVDRHHRDGSGHHIANYGTIGSAPA